MTAQTAIPASVAWTPGSDLSFDEWAEEGRAIQTAALGSRWWLGDWMRYGEVVFGDRAPQAVEMTGLHVDSLRMCVYVAERIEPERRVEALTFSHHREVAPFEPDEQDEWLRRAEEEGWSRDQLRKAIRDAKGAPEGSGDGGDVAELAVRQSTLGSALRTALGDEKGELAYRVAIGWAERHAPEVVAAMVED